jgi:hypothetical protein
MFISKSKHEEILHKKNITILELSRETDYLKGDKERLEKELEQIESNNQSKLFNYLIVIGEQQIDAKGHYFEVDGGSLGVYRYSETGTEQVFYCVKFDYIVTV